jgi:hypothetical protein
MIFPLVGKETGAEGKLSGDWKGLRGTWRGGRRKKRGKKRCVLNEVEAHTCHPGGREEIEGNQKYPSLYNSSVHKSPSPLYV